MEVYSRPFDSLPRSQLIYDGSWCTNDKAVDRYMRINMDEQCRENKNSQMECPAMADGTTSSDSSTGKLAGFLMSFYCAQSLSISKLF